jgi:4-amino-4-deoxy-L-arabinose transferase-like glycosyltransferase
MWEGFDEYSHFAFIQHIAQHRSLPGPSTENTSRTVAESLRLVPAPWLTRDPGRGMISHEDYWALPPTERATRESTLRSMPREWAAAGADPPIRLWEAQQPPLFYWIATPAYWSVRHLPLPDQVWILRWFAVLISSVLVPLGFLTGRDLLGDSLGLGAAIVVTSMPGLMMSASRIGNECLAMTISGALVLLGLRILKGNAGFREHVIFGAILGLGLLTKAYFLAFLPWAVITIVVPIWKSSKKEAILRVTTALLPCLAICGWWYVRTMLLTGTVTGEEREVAVRAGSAMTLTNSVLETSWIRVVDQVLISHIWLGGWSFLVVRTWMYRAIELVIFAALLGNARQFAKPRTNLPQRIQLASLIFLFVSFTLGLAYHATTGMRTVGVPGTMGYYFYCLAVPEAIVLLVGCARLFPRLAPGRIVLALPGVFLALETFGLWFLQVPYYAGMIAHVDSGGLPAFRLARLGSGWFRTLVDHSLANKSAFLHANVLLTQGALFFCATVMLLGIALWSALRNEGTPAISKQQNSL